MERSLEELLHDAVLALRCRRRDEKAFEELVNRWEPRLYYYLRRIIENDDAVWDVLQETWLAVFKSIRKLKDPLNFPTWLYRISHNKSVNWLRKENKYAQMTNEQITEYSENNTLNTPQDTLPTSCKNVRILRQNLVSKMSLQMLIFCKSSPKICHFLAEY